MRAEHRAQQIVRGAHIGHPIAHGFVDRVLQRAAAGIHADHFRAQQAHARHVQPLPLHVFRAHVDHALHAEARRHGRRGHAVLPRAGLGDDAALAHALREQRLAQAVVDLVRAGVQQVFALDVNARAAEVFAEAAGELQRRGAARESSQQFIQFAREAGIRARGGIGALELLERRDQRFGNVAPAISAESAARIRPGLSPPWWS